MPTLEARRVKKRAKTGEIETVEEEEGDFYATVEF